MNEIDVDDDDDDDDDDFYEDEKPEMAFAFTNDNT